MRWEKIDEKHAILWGAGFWEPDVVITYDPGDQDDLLDDSWRVASNVYPHLNFMEENTTLPIEQIQRRVMVIMGNEPRERRSAVENQLTELYKCMMEVGHDD